MTKRIQCVKKACKWTGNFNLCDKKETSVSGVLVTSEVCPRCNGDTFTEIPDPIRTGRVDDANKLIKLIATHGRKFFFHKGDNSKFELDKRGKVWFVDSHTKRRIYTHYNGYWRGFSQGGTLRDLVCAIRNYIVTGEQMPIGWICPVRFNPDNGNIWGYDPGEAALLVQACSKLDIMKLPGERVEQ